MKVIKKRLDDLKHPEKNVRIHSEQQIRELKRSLEKFGQTRALVVDENNVILIGNGLYEAMVSLGYQEASVYVKSVCKDVVHQSDFFLCCVSVHGSKYDFVIRFDGPCREC